MGSLERVGKQTLTLLCCCWVSRLLALLQPPPPTPTSGGTGGDSAEANASAGSAATSVGRSFIWAGVLLGGQGRVGLQLRGWSGEPSGPHQLQPTRRQEGGRPPPGAAQTLTHTCTHIGASMHHAHKGTHTHLEANTGRCMQHGFTHTRHTHAHMCTGVHAPTHMHTRACMHMHKGTHTYMCRPSGDKVQKERNSFPPSLLKGHPCPSPPSVAAADTRSPRARRALSLGSDGVTPLSP